MTGSKEFLRWLLAAFLAAEGLLLLTTSKGLIERAHRAYSATAPDTQQASPLSVLTVLPSAAMAQKLSEERFTATDDYLKALRGRRPVGVVAGDEVELLPNIENEVAAGSQVLVLAKVQLGERPGTKVTELAKKLRGR